LLTLRPALVLAVASTVAGAVPWPIAPFDSMHPLGNNWGEYQDYGSGSYFHNGIDIITSDTFGVEVHAVQHGWVKGWGTISAELHYRLAVCDTNLGYTGRAPGWLYAHIDADRWHKEVGDEVQAGDLIGYLVDWPIDATFDHCHFARISDTGATWMRFPDITWRFIENPLLLLDPVTDTVPPVIQNARPAQKFAFCRNNSGTYQQPTSLSGDLDIVARIYDKTGASTGDSTWDKLVPYQVEYMIRSAGGTVVVPWTLSVQFSNELGWISDTLTASVVYKHDATCMSYGDYDAREYFFVVTNTDGDSIIELSDSAGKWQSALVPDGDYWVLVRASDVVGNSTSDSMLVTTDNGVAAAEPRAQPVLRRPLALVPAITSGEFAASFELAQPTRCNVALVDALGRVVSRLADGRLGSGSHRISGSAAEPGVYFVELVLGNGDRYGRKLVVTR
jgi:hypothetical protein